MFIDRVTIKIQAGRGGDGKLSFRHLKSHKGGPDGGDGGRGGDVVIQANHNTSSLYKYRAAKVYQAGAGGAGGTNRRHGRDAEELTLMVAPGTQVIESDTVVADLDDGASFVAAHGGSGGFGNAHFVSSTRQAPRFAELGEEGDEKTITLELKLIAQVGLIGLPNAGKSTLLSAISNAKPQVADYAFTTLTPNLGMVSIAETSYLFADIPGLIAGASLGKGLGDEFLRHVERTNLLVHLIDLSSGEWKQNSQIINQELAAYSKALTKKPQLVVLSKADRVDEQTITSATAQLTELGFVAGKDLFVISAATRTGLNELLYAVAKQLNRAPKKSKAESPLPVIRLGDDLSSWRVACEDGVYKVFGAQLERMVKQTNFNQVEGMERLRRILVSRGVIRELNKLGLSPGAQIEIAGKKLKW